MDADPSILGRQAGTLRIGYENIKRRIHSWVNFLLNVVAPRMTLKRCLSLSRKLMAIEAIYIGNQVEAKTNHTGGIMWARAHGKILVQIIILFWEKQNMLQNNLCMAN